MRRYLRRWNITNFTSFSNDDLFLSNVFILPEYRNNKYGKLLINDALNIAAKNIEHSPKHVFCDIVDDGLVSYYTDLGFHLVKSKTESLPYTYYKSL